MHVYGTGLAHMLLRWAAADCGVTVSRRCRLLGSVSLRLMGYGPFARVEELSYF